MQSLVCCSLFALLFEFVRSQSQNASASTKDASCAASSISRLLAKHTAISSQLAARGFDEAAISASAQLFANSGHWRRRIAVPRYYSDPPWSLPSNAVRVLALPMSDPVLTDAPTRRLASLALQAAREIADALPDDSRAWLPKASSLHATLFHPGLSPQSDTKGKHCNLPLPILPETCWQRTSGATAGSPTEAELRHELRAARRLAANVRSSALAFSVDRLALSSSGVLLLLLRPSSPRAARSAAAAAANAPGAAGAASGECVGSLRAAAAVAFPRAARKQTSGLVHVSLLRILSLPRSAYRVNSSVARALSALTAKWSERLRASMRASMRDPPHGGGDANGMAGLHARREEEEEAVVRMRGVLYIREVQILTLEGERHRLRFGGGGAEDGVNGTLRL